MEDNLQYLAELDNQSCIMAKMWRGGSLMCRCFCEKELLPEIRGSVKALSSAQESTQEIGQTCFFMCFRLKT